jgi:hypothetical protein
MDKDSKEIDDVLSNLKLWSYRREQSVRATYSKHTNRIKRTLDQAVSQEDYEKPKKLEMRFQKIVFEF